MRLIVLFIILGVAASPGFLRGQIITDGTAGAPQSLTLDSGANYDITQDLGTTVGANLFHSFETFNIDTGESATFSGAATIETIISRVTGTDASFIDGLLRSTISNADLYFLNPAGVVFGPNAAVDLSGSFHVSSADYLLFENDEQFFSNIRFGSVFSTAAPNAFGFLDDGNGAIDIFDSFLRNDGNDLSFIGGEVFVENSIILSLSARINIAAVNSMGEVALTANDLDVSSFSTMGNVTITAESLLYTGNIDASNESGGGSIFIRGNQIVIENQSELSAEVFSDGLSGNIDISGNNITIQNNSLLSGIARGETKGSDITLAATEYLSFSNSFIQNDVLSSGDGGAITIDVEGDTSLTNGSTIGSIVFGDGNGGLIDLQTGNLTIASGSAIQNDTEGVGQAGNTQISVTGLTEITGADSGILSITFAGNGGLINLTTDTLNLNNSGNIAINTLSSSQGSQGSSLVINASGDVTIDAASIQAANSGAGSGGSVTLNAENLTLSNNGSINNNLFSSSGSGSAINININDATAINSGGSVESIVNQNSSNSGGSITLNTGSLSLNSSGRIIANTASLDEAGLAIGSDIMITVTDDASIGSSSSIEIGSAGVSDAGKLLLSAQNLTLTDSGIINGNTDSSGQGGTIELTVIDTVTLSDAIIQSSATSSGHAGSIDITGDTLIMNSGARIEANTTAAGNGGEINIDINNATDISGSGTIITSSSLSSGNGGTITLSSDNLSIDDSARILAEVFGSGDGGTIDLDVSQLDLTNDSLILANTGGSGQGGTIDINVSGNTLISDDATIQSSAGGTGDAGVTSLITKNLTVQQSGAIEANTLGSGDGGAIDIEVIETTNISTGGQILSVATAASTGAGGQIDLATETFTIAGAGGIAANSFGAGNGGIIKITVNDLASITETAAIEAGTTGLGSGGTVTLTAADLLLAGEGRINTNTSGSGNAGIITVNLSGLAEITNNGAITSDSLNTADNAGRSGAVNLNVQQLIMQDSGSISTTSAGGSGENGSVTAGIGDAGGITIIAGDKVELLEGSLITTEAIKASGGQITIIAPNLVNLLDSRITTSVLGREGDGDGGNIFIDPIFVTLNNSLIQANAVFGDGGDITIIAGQFLQSEDSIVEASSEFGVNGNILIAAPNVDLTAALFDLPSDLLDADSWKVERCATRLGGTGSSFILVGRDGVPANPTDLLSNGFNMLLLNESESSSPKEGDPKEARSDLL